MNYRLFGASLSLVFLLTACGGGSGGNEGNSSTSRDTTPDFAAITGLYDADDSRNGLVDVSYFYVTPTGTIEQYNDMNDSYAGAKAMNCFRRAVAGDVNFALDNKQLISDGKGSYSLTLKGVTGVESTFTWTPANGRLLASYNGLSSATLIIGKGNDGIPGPLVLGGVKAKSVSIETIKGMICN